MAQIAAPGKASPAPGAATHPMEVRSETAPGVGELLVEPSGHGFSVRTDMLLRRAGGSQGFVA
jgi:hypothetical protein